MKCLFREPLYVLLSTAVERESDWYLSTNASMDDRLFASEEANISDHL